MDDKKFIGDASSAETTRLLVTDSIDPSINLENDGFADLPSSVFNLTNTIVGGGVLALPYAFSACGLLLGVFFLMFVALLSFFSLILLVRTTEFAKHRHRSTYREIARLAHGTFGVIVTDIALILACFGAMCSYLVIIADMLVPLIANWSGQCEDLINRSIIVGCSMVLLFPMSCLRYLNMFRFTSLLAVVAILYLTCAVVVKSGMSLSEGSLWDCKESGCFSLAIFSFDFFRTIPIISFAFTCQMNFFSIFAELNNPTNARMRLVCAISLSICSVLYLLIGMFGYLTFYDDVNGNILLNYDPDDVVINLGRFGVTLVILFSYPLMAHPCVNTIDDLIFAGRAFSWRRRILTVFVMCSASLLVALFVTDVSLIFGITGATAGSMIAFILPSSFYLTISPESHKSPYKIAAWVMLTLGFIFMIASTTVTIIDEVNPPVGANSTLEFNSTLCKPGSGNATLSSVVYTLVDSLKL